MSHNENVRKLLESLAPESSAPRPGSLCWWCKKSDGWPGVCNDEETIAMCSRCVNELGAFFAPRAALASPRPEPPTPITCEHEWVTWMIQMPEGHSKPGLTSCAKCGVPQTIITSTITTTADEPAALPARSRPAKLQENHQRLLDHMRRELLTDMPDSERLRMDVEQVATDFQELQECYDEACFRNRMFQDRADKAEAALVAGEARLRELEKRFRAVAMENACVDDGAWNAYTNCADAVAALLRRPPE